MLSSVASCSVLAGANCQRVPAYFAVLFFSVSSVPPWFTWSAQSPIASGLAMSSLPDDVVRRRQHLVTRPDGPRVDLVGALGGDQ